MVIKCNPVSYRQGFIEVSNVHDKCINLEAWEVSEAWKLADDPGASGSANAEPGAVPEEHVTGNVELELSVEQAADLIRELQKAVEMARKQRARR